MAHIETSAQLKHSMSELQQGCIHKRLLMFVLSLFGVDQYCVPYM